jgi:hypothetical protein
VKHSASTIKDHRRCERIPLWKHVVGIRPPPSAGQQRGIDAHLVLENHLKGDLTVARESLGFDRFRDAWRVVEPALAYLPRPGPDVEAERSWDWTWQGLTFTGKVDVTTPTTIYDLKTTKYAKFAPTEVELRTDPQGIIYFKEALLRGHIEGCRWVFTLTKGKPRAWAVDFVPVVEGPVVDLLLEHARVIEDRVARKVLPLAVEPNTSACGDFGGCPYRAHCTDLDPLDDIFGSTDRSESMASTEDRLAKFRQSLVPAVAINPPEAAEAGPPPVPPPSKDEAPAEKVKLKRAPKAQMERDMSPPQGAPQGAPTSAPPSAPPSAPTGRHLLTNLFVDCSPGRPVKDAAILVDLAHRVVQEEMSIQDYRFAEYGSGAGALRAAFARVLDVERPDELYLDTDTPEGKIILVECLARCSDPVRRK